MCKKKYGILRLCVDYRALNAMTKSYDFPIEDATSLMYDIGHYNLITTLDLLKGYCATPMEKKTVRLRLLRHTVDSTDLK